MWTSSPSSPSPSTNSNNANTSNYSTITNPNKTMEDIWREISLASDHYLHTNTPSTTRGIILQDFFSRDPSVPPPSPPPPPPPPPVAPTMLTLRSADDGHMNSALFQPIHRHHEHVMMSALNPLVDGSGGSGKKRLPESDWSSADRHNKRMIKNRESAARSRARKQAYTHELELEVANLLEENARLKKQQQQLNEDAASQMQKKKPLLRTSTAPF